eukprot:TRINITY_DN5706_c0_g2_i1.p2 TRINITY_DN5706_c0_g2~~TRINITY_DN5706_c0_g2_i1.p2  ORF type:complete len:292 (-),score=9.57 TRINITY_DN5706_c0_g2_i1:380-1207(-)
MGDTTIAHLPTQLLSNILTLARGTWLYSNIFDLNECGKVSKSFQKAVEQVNLKILAVDLRDKPVLLPYQVDFAKFQNLQYLDMSYQFQLINAMGLPHKRYGESVWEQLPQLKQVRILVMNYCDGVTPQQLDKLFSSWGSTLTQLQAQSCPSAIGDGSCLRHLKHIQKLNMQWNRIVRSEHLSAILQNAIEVDLHGCESVDDEVCKFMPRVRHLSIGFTKIGDQGMEYLAENSKDLRLLGLGQSSFNLWESTQITKLGVQHFQNLRPETTLRFAQV